jgi:two-component system, OmpR family, sensor histidine kinase TctE
VPRALTRGIDLGFDDASADTDISGDPFLVRELINNLIDNALNYTPSGGRVTVRVMRDAGLARLEVDDDGCGIPEDERERVFERFYRSTGGSPEGCGLGLAIVREIAQGHGASSTIRSGANDRGTRVIIAFPALD